MREGRGRAHLFVCRRQRWAVILIYWPRRRDEASRDDASHEDASHEDAGHDDAGLDVVSLDRVGTSTTEYVAVVGRVSYRLQPFKNA